MVQPINYFQGVQDPFAQALAGMRLGETYAANQRAQEQARQLAIAKQQQLEQQIQEQQKIATARDTFLAKPKPTMQDALTFASILPKDQADAIRPYIEGVSKEQQQNVLRFNGQVLSALQTDPPAGIRLLRERALAERTSGDEQEASLYERMADTAEKQGPEIAFKGLTYIISSMPGAKEMFENIDKTLSTSRLEAEQPLKARKLTAETVVEEAKAKYAPQKFGLEINLTESQIKQADAAIRASDAAAKLSGAQATRAEAEAKEMAMGVIPADKRTAAEAQFRKEYSDQTKGYQDTKAAYGRILAVSDPKTPDEEAAADLALVFNFMKMQDPGSTVNSGEFANAQNAAGVGDRVVNLYNNLLKGSRLNPSQRKSFRGQAENLYKVTGQQEDIVRQGIGRIATGYGLNLNNIFYTATEVAPVALRTPGTPPAAPARATNPPAGQRNITVDY
jgi:hypothetical protein